MAKLADIAREAGIIGAGGAGFPTHVKLSSKVDSVIINGAECEPLMQGDQYLMESRAESLASTLAAVADDLSSIAGKQVKAVFGVKEKYKKQVALLKDLSKKSGAFTVLELPNVYPAGDEQFLVYEATGRIVPEGGIPLHVGAVVMNVGTLANLADAMDGNSVTHRIVTLGGEIANPQVASIPIGMPLSVIIPMMGPKSEDYAILLNGPMMGRITNDLNEVITKTTGGVFLLPKNHSHVYRMSRPLSTEIRLGKSACEACRYCTDFCPRYLQGHAIEPHKIMRVMNYDRDLDTDTITAAWLCCECGVCDLWACPMFLSPRVFFREFKKRLSAAGIKNPHSNADLSIDYYRQYRGVPADRLLRRLGLSEYEVKSAFNTVSLNVDEVRIPLNQHIGALAAPIVAVGDKVKSGQLVAEIPEGKLGARYHASISGSVAEVNASFIRIKK